MDSPLLLHKQHQSITINPLLQRLFKVRILPREAVHTKKLTRSGTLTFQMPFHGKEEHPTSYRSEEEESTKERSYLKNLPLGRNPTNPIHPSHISLGLIQFTVESHHHLHLPILSFFEKLNIAMNFLIYNLHMLTHPSLFVPCHAK